MLIFLVACILVVLTAPLWLLLLDWAIRGAVVLIPILFLGALYLLR